ncbi:MAG: cupin domain-containing protein [Pseudomonadota bacterium]
MASDNFFNINDMSQGIHRKLAEGVTTRVFVGEKAMLSVARLEPNSSGKIHSHPQEQWGICIEGEGVRIQEGTEVPFKAGDFWCTPGGVDHGIRVGEAGATVIDVFSPPRPEYTKPGEGFGS